MTALAVIPARGGSKRIPRKNIRNLGSLPMMAYTLKAALESGVFKRVVVSTDDDDVAKVAKAFGADIPFMRKAELADDQTHASLVSLDALSRLEAQGESYNAIAQLMPNCPFRTAEDIKQSYKQFCSTGVEAQVTVTRYGWQNPWWALKMQEGVLKPLFPEAHKARSQDLGELYCPVGAIWWAKAKTLKAHKTFLIEGRAGFELPWQHALDIDDEADWQLAEVLIHLKDKA